MGGGCEREVQWLKYLRQKSKTLAKVCPSVCLLFGVAKRSSAGRGRRLCGCVVVFTSSCVEDARAGKLGQGYLAWPG